MLKSLRRFSALEPAAQRLFLRAVLMLPVVSLRLKLHGFQSTHAALRKTFLPANPPKESEIPDKRAALTARMVNAADRHGLVHSTCLAKSLTLWWLLGRQGIASQLRIGIRKDKEKLEAHAWVEREGIALNEPEQHHRHYAAFDASLASLPEEKN